MRLYLLVYHLLFTCNNNTSYTGGNVSIDASLCFGSCKISLALRHMKNKVVICYYWRSTCKFS